MPPASLEVATSAAAASNATARHQDLVRDPRAADQARQLLAGHLDLHAFRMRHCVRFAAQIHDGVRHAAGDIDEGQIAELAIGAVKAGGELGGQLPDPMGCPAGVTVELMALAKNLRTGRLGQSHALFHLQAHHSA